MLMEDFFFKVLELLATLAFAVGSPHLTAKSKEGQESLRSVRFWFLYKLIGGIVILVLALTVDIAPWFVVFQLGCAVICFVKAADDFFVESAVAVRLIEALPELTTEESAGKGGSKRE